MTVHFLEQYLEHRYTRQVENIYIGDTGPLFAGRVRLSEAIGNNIEGFLQRRTRLLTGAIVDVRVTSGGNTWVYPSPLDPDADRLDPPTVEEIAAENFRLMNRGLSVSVSILLGWNTALAMLIFIAYILLAGFVFMLFYISWTRQARSEAEEREAEINRLRAIEKQHLDRMNELNEEKRMLSEDIAAVKKSLLEYKATAGINEEAMIDEIISLEEKIRKNYELAEALRQENESLKAITDRYQGEKRRGVKKSAVYGNIEKRFKTLYKNVVMHKRAIDGFTDLVDDMKIKAEEAVRQIDVAPSLVNIKRKVDLKKSSEKIFEVTFAYNGRLYFRNMADGRVEVLAIGSKNTQVKDMSFLNTL